MKKTWKERPTIINKIPVDNEAMILFIDESGEGNSKILKRAFQDKITGVNYKQRNDLFILNGVVMTGKEHINLTNRFNELKEIVSNDGVFNYEKKRYKTNSFTQS